MRDIKFEQLPLITGGHQYLTVGLTLHLDGKSSEIHVGYEITNTVTLETIELGTLGVIGARSAVPALAVVLTELMIQAEKHLAPFG